jgi:hypothetical protein
MMRALSSAVAQLRKHSQVHVEPHPLDPAHPQRHETSFVLEPSERTLDARAATVESAPAQRLARDQRVCSRSALIHTEAGLHSPVGQRHLVAPRFLSAPANRHLPCSQQGGLCSPRLTAVFRAAGSRAARPGRSTPRRWCRCRSPCPSRTSRARSRARRACRAAARQSAFR